jgi:hypothetical protein
MKTLVVPTLFISALTVSAADFTLHSFKKQQLEKYYWSEGAMLGDLNKDGKADAVYGPYWWEGPDFTKRHEIYPAKRVTKTKKDGKDVEFPATKATSAARTPTPRTIFSRSSTTSMATAGMMC